MSKLYELTRDSDTEILLTGTVTEIAAKIRNLPDGVYYVEELGSKECVYFIKLYSDSYYGHPVDDAEIFKIIDDIGK